MQDSCKTVRSRVVRCWPVLTRSDCLSTGALLGVYSGANPVREEITMSVMATSVVELTTDAGLRILDRETRKELGVSARTFIEAYESGEFPADWDVAALSRLEMLLPLAR